MVAVALPAVAAAAANTVSMPVYYEPYVSTQVLANFTWGTPASGPIQTVIDTGSPGFWVWGPNATVNSGSPYLFVPGPCNRTAEPFFDWPASSTHTNQTTGRATYAYGGNGKIIACPFGLNDTLGFGSSTDYPPMPNQQVSICDYAIIKDRSCEIYYDKSILGLSPYVGNGPRFRDNLLADGLVTDTVFSMWFDALPGDVNDPQTGTLLFGAVPDASHYTGSLVTVNQTQPEGGFYYAALPEVRGTRIDDPAAESQAIDIFTPPSGVIPDCLVDSGTHGLTFPLDAADLQAKTGLVENAPYVNLAYPAPCNDIPADATLDLVFTGLAAGEKVTIKLPYRNMVQGPGARDPSICSLALQVQDPTCVLGGTFYAAAVVVHDDVGKTLSLAQGGGR
ncbi:aspartic peptidase domain-containing protein [Microdochium trichocladiopsis]|uniref:Aspartic peptidase domain-containing protein n=1 Tax=Microdochium trichocladiopsis TaxID=1682393 RepID=A0A9P8XVD3_9PEZI|nr:aspartic peptidase domain-containing protein [Microdochium trichocladiopsis]KAH7014443.1 aspartic peptidase domain-containing protein [Microdochium trichocladiopsis]